MIRNMRTRTFYDLNGYDLHTHPETWKPSRVVACLNVWNDAAELGLNILTWIEQVDHIIAVVGPYFGVNEDIPDDGTLNILKCADAEIIMAPGLEQPEKRTGYFDACREGDLCVAIAADERFTKSLPDEYPYFDVGWIRYTSPIYLRPQNTPRLFRWRPGLNYRTRHHWLYEGDEMFCTAQRGGEGLIHRQVDAEFHNSRGKLREPKRQRIGDVHRFFQHQKEQDKAPDVRAIGHEPLRIIQAAPFDPGCVCFRLHTAINTTTPHTSVLTTGCEEWTNVPRQFDHTDEIVPRLEADISHYHVNYAAPIQRGRWTVIHHHGTEYRLRHDYFNEQDRRAHIRLVSNFELMQYGDDLTWLPNPIPVAEYHRLAANKPEWDGKTLIVAHSPTKRKHKGTAEFLSAVQRVRAKGIDVRAHLINKLPIKAALDIKAQSHVVFDSFWLGIQCSGLEGAAMGLPVIAGDTECFQGYLDHVGYVPYTFANNEDALVNVLARLATDERYYRTEAKRVSNYCLEYHDSANVAARYIEILDEKLNWRNTLAMGTP